MFRYELRLSLGTFTAAIGLTSLATVLNPSGPSSRPGTPGSRIHQPDDAQCASSLQRRGPGREHAVCRSPHRHGSPD